MAVYLQCFNQGNTNKMAEIIRKIEAKKQDVYTLNEVLNMLIEQTTLSASIVCSKNYKMKQEQLSELFEEICVIFNFKRVINRTEILEKLPFLKEQFTAKTKVCFKPDEQFYDDLIRDIAVINSYAKEKTFSPKTTRWLYELKNKGIKLLYNNCRSKITDEWYEKRDDGENFISYQFTLGNGEEYTFHQPLRNVVCLYKTSVRLNKVLANTKEFHIERTEFNERWDKNDYYRLLHLISLKIMLLENYYNNSNIKEND